MNAPFAPSKANRLTKERAERKAKRIAYLERREAERAARARAPVGWLENYNDGTDELVRGLIRGFE